MVIFGGLNPNRVICPEQSNCQRSGASVCFLGQPTWRSTHLHPHPSSTRDNYYIHIIKMFHYQNDHNHTIKMTIITSIKDFITKMKKRSGTFTKRQNGDRYPLWQEQSNFRSNEISCLGQFQLYLAFGFHSPPS